MADDFAAFTRKIDGLAKEFDGRAFRKRVEAVAVQTKKDVDEAVRAEGINDQSMSGWRRGKPIPIKGRFDMTSDTTFEVNPEKRGRGPMRVLEDGRNAGGVRPRKGRKGRARRNNGQTRGKSTWSDAVKLMQDRVGKRMDKQVAVAIRQHMRRG